MDRARKSHLILNRSKLIGCTPNYQAHRACLVEKKWHTAMIQFLDSSAPPPSRLANLPLKQAIDRGRNLTYHIDFEVVSMEAWDLIISAFPADCQIVQLFVQHPDTGKPVVLFNPKRLTIETSDKNLTKSISGDWTLGGVKKQLCAHFQYSPKDYAFYELPSNSIVSEKMTADSFLSNPERHLVLKKIERTQSEVIDPTIESRNRLSVHPTGLVNLGNTCFFNAAVQCLVHVDPLTKFVLSDRFDGQINRDNTRGSRGEIALQYRNFLLQLCESHNDVMNPSSLRNAIIRKYSRFANFGQQDSSELLGALLDGLHEDLNQSNAAGGRLPPSPTKFTDDSWNLHISKNSSPILTLFHGTLKSSITCDSCHHSESVYDPFIFLSLPIPSKFLRKTTLRDCLDNFCSTEILDTNNKWRCEHCGNLVTASKATKVQKCAKILIIVLNRFFHQGTMNSKIETCVEYPDVLERISEENDSKFELIGSVFHTGSLCFGHYTAAALDSNTRKWYLFNDSSVTEVDQSHAHSKNAYILFYQKID